jgi:hypothetical protein
VYDSGQPGIAFIAKNAFIMRKTDILFLAEHLLHRNSAALTTAFLHVRGEAGASSI